MDEDVWMYDMMMKLSGVIFRKALIEDDFSKVYGQVFDRMTKGMFEDEINILEIFGNVGG